MTLAASAAEMPSVAGATMAKLLRSLPLIARSAAPAILRTSEAAKFLAFPPPIRSRRLAFSPAGLCKRVDSIALPVTSPEAIRSAAAALIAASSVSSWICGLSFAPLSDFSAASTTATTRHSVSSCEGLVVESTIFIRSFFQYLRFSAAGDGFARFLVSGFSALGFAFVPGLLAFGKRHLDLYAAVAKVHACRDEREAFLMCLTYELVQFAAVDQQFPGAQWRVPQRAGRVPLPCLCPFAWKISTARDGVMVRALMAE